MLSSRPKIRDYTILDQHGQEMASSKTRRMVPMNPRGMQTFNSHPAVGLTVESLASYYRRAEAGSPLLQNDVFDDLIERLAEMRGMFEERNDDIAGADFSVVPPPDRNDKPSKIAAQALQEYLQYNVATNIASKTEQTSACFRTWMEHQGTSVPYGFAASNQVWDYVDGLIVPVRYEPVAARRFGAPSADKAHQIWLIDGDKLNLVELEAGLWSVTKRHHRNPYASGLMRSCAWWALFALTTFKQWQIYADMFGLPLAIGYYEEGASLPSREKLELAVRMLGQDGWAVLSAMTELVIKEAARSGDSSTLYPHIFAVCMNQITKLITGGSLNTDTSSSGVGSYNAAKVHESRAYKMKRRDATRIEEEFAHSIGLPFILWNGFSKAGVPRLKSKIARDELARAQALETIGMAMPISKAQIREEFNLREPIDKEDEVSWTPTATPDPNRQRPEKK